ncbi:WD40 repeat-like protein [Paxillus ammoniavirescens]|nr:WD40 repeat-like protein [Paxillus ammoniavirescens]
MESNTPTHSIDLTAKPLVTMSGHEGMVLRIAYIPGGQQVVTCSGDRTIRIWDAENGEQEGTSMEHEGWIEGLVITRDGKRILSGCQKNKMRVWDVETHELIEEWEHHTEGRLWCIAMSPDDQLAANGDDKGEIVIRDMNESGQIKHSIETGTVVESLCFSPNGEKLACAVNGRALEADGDRVYAIRVYDVQSGELILGPVKGHESEVIRVIWSLDGSQLFSASHDHTIRCWDSETAEPIGEPWTGHTGYIYSLSLSPDGSKLASASHDETVRFWDAHSGVPIVEYTLHHEDRLCVVTFSPSGEFVATGGYKHKVSIWRVPWWDSSQKQPHQSLLDRPAVLVPKGLSNNQQQRELDFLDLPTSRRPFISSPRPPADSAPVSAMKRVQRFWHGLVARRSSSPRQQAIEVDGVQNRRFWKSRIRAPVTEVAAGRLTDRVKVGRREPRRKKTHHKSQKSHEPQKHTILCIRFVSWGGRPIVITRRTVGLYVQHWSWSKFPSRALYPLQGYFRRTCFQLHPIQCRLG